MNKKYRTPNYADNAFSIILNKETVDTVIDNLIKHALQLCLINNYQTYFGGLQHLKANGHTENYCFNDH